ncbi:MAG: nucleotidyl transferase AbiEii/AbiGii toxin family protein [Flavobacteriales bacterium]|nr:nucleotidyl transferase AbiEii/AbiGii toxin family protein [Flavobacteriales bacterium]NCP85130.1 nucleotidyl transferase AbiEii/AbiGii toxin family protein [Bacteroidota bacterium]
MHTEIFNDKQIELLPYIKPFKKSFYMVGGTAIALHIGHRRSIDFDLFTNKQLKKVKIKGDLAQIPFNKLPIFEDFDQLHFIINDVKMTFFSFPFTVKHPVEDNLNISIPTLRSLAAMKAFALGRRAKWKDYVDLYFIIREYYNLKEICSEAEAIFGQQFSEKLFRQQLAYHKDIDYTESVEFLVPPVPDDEIKNFLIDKATDIF